MENAAPEHAEHLGPDSPETTAAVIKVLSKRPVYALDAPLTQFVRQRVAFLCGDTIPPAVFVVDDPDPNACMVADTMVVGRGLIETLEFQEELDGVLMHELVHHFRKHTHEAPADTIPASIGQVRSHETQTDLEVPERLDALGINPRGYSSALNKLAAYHQQLDQEAAAQRPTHPDSAMEAFIDDLEQSFETHSPTHGQDRARALNVEQLALLIDLPHLSHQPLIPLPLSKELLAEKGAITDDDDIVLRQAALARAGRTLQQKYRPPQEHQPFQGPEKFPLIPAAELAEYAHQQEKLLLAYDPQLTPAMASELAAIAAARLTQDWGTFMQPYTNQDVSRLTNLVRTPAFIALTGQLDPTWEAGQFASHLLTQTCLNASVEADVAEVLATLTTHFGNDFLSDTVLNEVLKSPRVSKRKISHFAELCAASPLAYASGSRTDPAQILFLDTFYGKRQETARHIAQNQGLEAALVYLVGFPVSTTSEESDFEFFYWQTTSLSGEQNASLIIAKLIDAAEPTSLAAVMINSGLPQKDKKAIGLFLERWYRVTNPTHPLSTKSRISLAALTLDPAKAISTVARALEDSIQDTLDGLYQLPSAQAINFSGRLRAVHKAFSGHLKSFESLLTPYAASLGYNNSREITQAAIRHSEFLRDYSTMTALEVWEDTGEPTLMLELMEQRTPARIRNGGLFGDPDLHEHIRQVWETATNRLLTQPDLLDDESQLLSLVALGIICPDVQVSLHVPGQALLRVIRGKTFDEALELIFSHYSHLPAYVLHPSIDYLVESGAQTARDFEQIKTFARDHLRQLVDGHLTEIGIASTIETNLLDIYQGLRHDERRVGLQHDVIQGLNSATLLSAMLRSSQDDLPLKEQIFIHWWQVCRRQGFLAQSAVTSHFEVENGLVLWRPPTPDKRLRLEWWLSQVPDPGTYTPLTDVLNNMYLANSMARFATVRRLLTGEHGVLEDVQGRASLTNALLDSWLDFEEGSSAHHLMDNVLRSLMDSAPPHELYHYLGPVLQDLILRPPGETASIGPIISQKAHEIYDAMTERGRLQNPPDKARDIRILTTKLTTLAQGVREVQPSKSSIIDQLNKLFPDQQGEAPQRLSPTQFALLAGKKAGALGTRILQFAGQYFNIPPEDSQEFSEVYDGMKGQSRLQAYQTLQKEAKTNPLIATYLPHIAEFGERIGGGSLVTVYKVTLTDGRVEALGVANPNVEFHLVRMADLMDNTLERALQNDPTNTDLQLARVLLHEAVAMLRDELHDTHFDHKDSIFRQQNATSTAGGFTRGSSRYEAYVPQSTPTGTSRIRRDEFIEGRTLNNLEVSTSQPTNIAAGVISLDDFRSVVSLQSRNLLFQILEGDYAHADMHAGQFSITTGNNQMAIFDRRNLIPITPELRATMQAVIRHIGGNSQGQAVQALLSHDPANASSAIEDLLNTLLPRLAQEPDLLKGMDTAIIETHRTGLHIPRALKLLLRNISCQAKLARKAHFDNLADCILHTANPQEIERLMQVMTD